MYVWVDVYVCRLAVDERSKPYPPGTYLVRMGKDEHPFTISLVTKAGFAHKRVGHVWYVVLFVQLCDDS